MLLFVLLSNFYGNKVQDIQIENYPTKIFLIYHRGWLNAKCNLSFSLILADISSIYPFSEKSELAKTSEK